MSHVRQAPSRTLWVYQGVYDAITGEPYLWLPNTWELQSYLIYYIFVNYSILYAQSGL